MVFLIGIVGFVLIPSDVGSNCFVTKLIAMGGCLDIIADGCSFSADGNCWMAGGRSEMSFESRQELVFVAG